MPTNLKYSDLKTFGQVSAEQLSITGEYSFPIADGSPNQILSTDGSGNVQFIDLSNLQIVTATNILNGTGINWTITGLNTVQGDVTLSPFSTTDLAEGVNLYFTNERVDDRVSNLLQPGITGSSLTVPLTWIYNDSLNTLTPQISISAFTTDNLPQGSSNLYFSGELVDDRVALLLKPAITGTNPTNPIIWNYVDGLDSLTPQVSLSPFNTDALSEGLSNLYFTDDRAIDAVGGALVNSATVLWNFNPILNTIEATATTGISGLEIKLDGGTIATQPTLEFLTGSNIILNGANDSLNNKVTIEINSTLGGNLEDLNDVFFLSPGPQFEEVLYFNGAAWTSTDLESILPPNYESITHSDLKIKVSANALVPNRMYLINDYATIYNMPGTSPQVEITGATEPLIVKAISVNRISHIAYSPLYPQDIIHYSLNPQVSFRNTTASNKGIIYHRFDTIDRNSYPADFRSVQCRRWDNGSGNYEILTENGNSYNDYPIFALYCKNNLVEPIDPDFAAVYSISEDLPNVYFEANSVGNSFSSFTYGISPKKYISNIQSTGIMVDVIFRDISTSIFNTGAITITIFESSVTALLVKSENNSLGITNCIFSGPVENCEVNTLQNSNFSGNFTESKIFSAIACSFGSTVQLVNVYSMSAVVTGDSFSYVEGTSINNCTFAGAVDGLYFTKLQNVDFQDITNCSMKNFENTLFTSPAPTVGSNFSNNILGADFIDNTIGDNFTGNVIGYDCNTNTFGDDFQNNRIGVSFNNNSIGKTFNNNSIGDSFSNNSIGDSFIRNTIEYQFSSNTIGDSFQNNVIGNRFSQNSIGDTFTFNAIIPGGLRLCTIINDFSNNVISTPVTGVNFSSATHVYAAYTCQIFVRAGGTSRLSYVDGSDTVIYAAINA
jgi:hypothetical protein